MKNNDTKTNTVLGKKKRQYLKAEKIRKKINQMRYKTPQKPSIPYSNPSPLAIAIRKFGIDNIDARKAFTDLPFGIRSYIVHYGKITRSDYAIMFCKDLDRCGVPVNIVKRILRYITTANIYLECFPHNEEEYKKLNERPKPTSQSNSYSGIPGYNPKLDTLGSQNNSREYEHGLSDW